MDEALIIGYTVDLVFLERFFVPTARGLGARVTVVADAHNLISDLVDVKAAGRSYQLGMAFCRGSFHPKVVVFQNNQFSWVAIGSGNPTTAGWGHNGELWLTIKATAARAPRALKDLAGWLSDLHRAVVLPSWISSTLRSIASRLIPSEIDPDWSDLRIVHNLTLPIIEQLPSEPVDTLRLTAPFHDPNGRAHLELVRRFRPRTVQLALQENLATYRGAAIVEAVGGTSLEVRLQDEKRLTHGKLIEWERGSQIVAMTGSANVTAAALLTATVEGANCELVTIQTVEGSLLPPGNPTAIDEIKKKRAGNYSQPTELDLNIQLLGAQVTATGIEAELVIRREGDLSFEYSPNGGPNSWTQLVVCGKRAVGPTTESISLRISSGSLLRARVRASKGGDFLSTPVVLHELYKCQAISRGSSGKTLSQDYAIRDLFGDDVLAERFAQDIEELIKSVPPSAQLRTSSVGGGSVSAEVPQDRWGEWVNEVELVLQPTLTHALFPGVVRAVNSVASQWVVDVEEGEDIAEGESEEAVDPFAVTVAFEHGPVALEPSEHRRWRMWDRRLRTAAINGAGKTHEALLISVLKVHLDLLATDLWGPDDPDWAFDLLELLDAVARPLGESEIPSNAKASAAGMVAISFRLLFDELAEVGGDELDLCAQRLWKDLAGLVALARDEDIAHHTILLGSRYGRTASEERVRDLRDRAERLSLDPHSEVRAQLESLGIRADFHNGAWFTSDFEDFGNGRKTAAKIADIVGRPCAALAADSRGVFAVLYVDGHVAYADSRINRWNLYSRRLGGPSSILSSETALTDTKVRFPLTNPGKQIEAMCATVGVSKAELQLALRGW
ncbi:hypothetical protein SAMN06265174_101525 [Dietzia kunjamensis subsp. schimae]|uniref:Phospholipase D-like domain-containing protein n=2 Tax=Dietzia kunjamensis TaxID=322509 RepID=A0ABY1MYB8_9ACTN|nr:hypothetical protein SAMN06265174_101525 [Dietzia kunjamensis subsp. schimae]